MGYIIVPPFSAVTLLQATAWCPRGSATPRSGGEYADQVRRRLVPRQSMTGSRAQAAEVGGALSGI